jgi:hypothetical protein
MLLTLWLIARMERVAVVRSILPSPGRITIDDEDIFAHGGPKLYDVVVR